MILLTFPLPLSNIPPAAIRALIALADAEQDRARVVKSRAPSRRFLCWYLHSRRSSGSSMARNGFLTTSDRASDPANLIFKRVGENPPPVSAPCWVLPLFMIELRRGQ